MNRPALIIARRKRRADQLRRFLAGISCTVLCTIFFLAAYAAGWEIRGELAHVKWSQSAFRWALEVEQHTLFVYWPFALAVIAAVYIAISARPLLQIRKIFWWVVVVALWVGFIIGLLTFSATEPTLL
ncbi:MAG TPA: hypothetical protein VEJ20_00290 [Candidatus Eremiobacteraceae bacterium]|nr:hypothetical protein [Candidatus Eremiobacteraceae bacterium]